MRVGSLFAGIGGFDLAARWIGWETIWFSEIDPYASAVLKQHWPDVPNLGDITKVDWSTVERPDLLCGGFPCQDISVAGKGEGIDGARSGLWREFARAIRELRPRYVVVENVAVLLRRGVGRVLGDLAALGYDAEWTVLSAADVGAPHLRERLWIVGYPECAGLEGYAGHGPNGAGRPESGGSVGATGVRCRGAAVADAEREPERAGLRKNESGGLWRGRPSDGGSSADLPYPTDGGRSVRRGTPRDERHALRDDLQTEEWRVLPWTVEPHVGRVAHGIPSRVDRLTGLGNAIVPACAVEIFRAIEEAERWMSA